MQFIYLILYLLQCNTIQCGRFSSGSRLLSQGSRFLGVKGSGSVGPKNIITPELAKLSSNPAQSSSKGRWAKAGDVVNVAGKGGMVLAGVGTLFTGIAQLISGQSAYQTYSEETQVNIPPI